MSHPVLEFRGVRKRFNSVTAVDGVTFSIQPGEIFTLLGPSGCGKTTTLRLVAGLEEPDDGEIFIDGIPVAVPRRAIILGWPGTVMLSGPRRGSVRSPRSRSAAASAPAALRPEPLRAYWREAR